jgi:hypothetical protein
MREGILRDCYLLFQQLLMPVATREKSFKPLLHMITAIHHCFIYSFENEFANFHICTFVYKKAGLPGKEPWFDYDPTLTACQNL